MHEHCISLSACLCTHHVPPSKPWTDVPNRGRSRNFKRGVQRNFLQKGGFSGPDPLDTPWICPCLSYTDFNTFVSGSRNKMKRNRMKLPSAKRIRVPDTFRVELIRRGDTSPTRMFPIQNPLVHTPLTTPVDQIMHGHSWAIL